ncbi:MAG: sel1 repeat family protein [Selenomonadaceae bacterium]|nr:sel1 repeat family protein [Selenomonadaceae bacterium]
MDDLKIDIKILEVLANSGDTDAMNKIGYHYHYGEGVKQNFIEARRWYETAAEFGSHKAVYNLGLIYCEDDNLEKDF